MKNLKYNIGIFLALALLFSGCQEDDIAVGDIIASSNIEIAVTYIDEGVESPAPGLGSGTVEFTATADNVISYQYVYNGNTTSAPGGKQSFDFAVLGLNTYAVTVIAFGTGGVSSSKTIEVEVLSTYDPPADLVEMLTANDSRVWKIAAEEDRHFGLGDVGNDFMQHFGAAPFSKADSGMYDDRYIFNIDGTFTHITNSENDDPDQDPTGTIFGRTGLIDELNGPGEFTDGDDTIQYPYSDYSEQYTLTAPGGVETISLTGKAFIGYYIGGTHKYIIELRSANEMSLRSTDGNNEFDWGIVLVPE